MRLLYLFVVALLSLPASSNEAARAVVLQLKWTPQFQFAGYYVAQELGFYDEAGLQVEIRPGGPGLNSLSEVVTGRAQFGISSSNLLAEHIMGAPVKVLAAIFQTSPARFVTLESSGIETAEDLAGKRVMLLPGNSSFELITLLTQLNLRNRIERQNTSFNIQSLVDGETDAFNGYITNEPYLLEEQGVDYSLIDPADYGIRFYSDVLFTSEQLANSSPDLVRSFAKASLRGWQYALDHPAEAVQILSQFAPEKSLSHLRYEALSMHEHIADELVPLGYMNENRWLSIKEFLASIGEIPKDAALDIDKFIFPLEEPELDWRLYWHYVATVAALVLSLVSWGVWAHRRKAVLQEQLEDTFEMATHDALTGLANRSLFIDRFEQVLSRKRRSQVTPMIAFIDINKFKAVNDHCGHQVGDDFLKAIAEAMLKELRPSDTLARIGGDEFVLLVDDVLDVSETRITERLQTAIKRVAEAFELQTYGVGSAIGVLIIDANLPESPERLLALADREMYAAKSSQTDTIRVQSLSALSSALFDSDYS